MKGVEIDHLFYNKISDLTLKPLFSDNVLILIKIVTKIRPRFQHPLMVLSVAQAYFKKVFNNRGIVEGDYFTFWLPT